MTKIVACIVSRLSSMRLPQKSIMDVCGKPMVVRLHDRLTRCVSIDMVAIVTSSLVSDDPLEDISLRHGIPCYRGSLDNVMERISGAADELKADVIVEILGDNPLVDPATVDQTVTLMRKEGWDYCATLTTEYSQSSGVKEIFPLGVRVQAYSTEVAKQYDRYPNYIHTEKHPSAYIYDNPDQFKCGFLHSSDDWKTPKFTTLNLSVNYAKNLEFVREVFNFFGEQAFELTDIDSWLSNHPELLELLGADDI